MRFATLTTRDGIDHSAVYDPLNSRWRLLKDIDVAWNTDLFAFIQSTAEDRERKRAYARIEEAWGKEPGASTDAMFPTALLSNSHKIWGIGLNYSDHAQDLDAIHPEEPASFIKADHTVIGPNDPILLPQQSRRVTSEGELGIVIGRECRNVDESEALEYVFGVTAVLDQTAEDILQRNPRFLTRSKNFPTFLSLGPEVVTLDELLGSHQSLDDLTVGTVRNGQMVRSLPVANMRHSPQALISFHSQMMPLYPGDVICTGTPGAAVISSGDVVECHIDGLAPLVNLVEDASVH